MYDINGNVARVKHATVGKSVLDWIALLCLFGSCAFWTVLFWVLIVPADRQLPQVIIAVATAILYALVLPLLCSMLFPTTPAGMLLQKTQYRTWGFALIVVCALFLGWRALDMMELWWLAQPAVRDAGQARYFALSGLIMFVVVPALAWVQVTPDQWIAQVQQAHAVKKLQLMHEAELLSYKAAFAQSLAILHRGLSNATVEERQYVANTMRGLHSGINQELDNIAYGMRLVSGLEVFGAPDRKGIAASYDQIADTLAGEADEYREFSYVEPERDAIPAMTGATMPQRTHGAAQSNAIAEPLQWAKSINSHEARDGAKPYETLGGIRSPDAISDGAYDKAMRARELVGGEVWTAATLSKTLATPETTIRSYLTEWRAAGLVDGSGLATGRYVFTAWEG